MRLSLTLPAIAAAFACCAAQAQTSPGPRVAWLASADARSAETVERAVDAARAAGVGVLIVAGAVSADDGPASLQTFDPLQAALKRGHRLGLRVFAAVPTFDIVDARPDRVVVDRNGKAPEGAARRLDPGSPAARKEARDSVLAAVKSHIGLDGVVLTGVGYPGADAGFSDEDLSQFRTVAEPGLTREQKDALALLPDRDAWTRMFPGRWARWRRDNVSGFLGGVYRDLKAGRPALQVAAVVPVHGPFTTWETSEAFVSRAQDIAAWKQQGLLDIVLLQREGAAPAALAARLSAARAAPGAAGVWEATK